MAKIEVEFRAQLTKTEYDQLVALLNKEARLLSEQDQASYYFHSSGKAFKMVHDKDKNRVRVALKAKNLDQGNDFEEFEIVIDPSEIVMALDLFKNLLDFHRVIYDEQKRANYIYKGLEIALKWSEGWGYHLEIEKLVDQPSDVDSAEKEIIQMAKELGVKLMSTEQVKAVVDEIHRKLDNNEYKTARYL